MKVFLYETDQNLTGIVVAETMEQAIEELDKRYPNTTCTIENKTNAFVLEMSFLDLLVISA